jgi:hypothetical protein
MHLYQRIATVVVVTMAMAVCTGPALAGGHNYTGNWPVTVSGSQRSNGTFCLTLKGGTSGGQASLNAGSQKYPYGSFLVLDGLLIATITQPLYGQNGALMFTVPVKHGSIGQGVFEDVEGGSNFDAGKLTFGAKNGC